jgi:anti-sigma B factor antagonist
VPDSPVTSVEQSPGVSVVHILVDSLSEEQLSRLQSEVRAAADANAGQPVVLDFARVRFVPSLSLAAVIRIHTEFRSRNQRLILAGLQPQVRDVFVLARLDRLFELHDDVAAATRAVQPV